MSSVIEACRFQLAGCTVVITVDVGGGLARQCDVVGAIRATTADIAWLAVDALRAAAPAEADDEERQGVQPERSAAGVAAAAASGGPPPMPSPRGPADGPWKPPPPPPAKFARPAAASAAGAAGSQETARPADPAPPRTKTPPAPPPAAAKTLSTVASAGRVPPASSEHWGERLAYAEQHGADVAIAWAAGRMPPEAAPHPAPLRSRLWVAVGGAAEHVGLYSRWSDGAEVAYRHRPASTVHGFASLAEARAFARGAGVQDLPDLRAV